MSLVAPFIRSEEAASSPSRFSRRRSSLSPSRVHLLPLGVFFFLLRGTRESLFVRTTARPRSPRKSPTPRRLLTLVSTDRTTHRETHDSAASPTFLAPRPELLLLLLLRDALFSSYKRGFELMMLKLR